MVAAIGVPQPVVDNKPDHGMGLAHPCPRWWTGAQRHGCDTRGQSTGAHEYNVNGLAAASRARCDRGFIQVLIVNQSDYFRPLTLKGFPAALASSTLIHGATPLSEGISM